MPEYLRMDDTPDLNNEKSLHYIKKGNNTNNIVTDKLSTKLNITKEDIHLFIIFVIISAIIIFILTKWYFYNCKEF